MRLLHVLAGFMLIGTAAVAQPGPENGPGPDQQGGPPPQGQTMQRPPHMTMSQRFDAANVTNDGRLTLEQAQAARMGHIVKNFGQIDTDRKGYVTKQDIQAWHHATNQARRQQNPPQGQAPQGQAPQDGQPQYAQPSQYAPPDQSAPPQ